MGIIKQEWTAQELEELNDLIHAIHELEFKIDLLDGRVPAYEELTTEEYLARAAELIEHVAELLEELDESLEGSNAEALEPSLATPTL